ANYDELLLRTLLEAVEEGRRTQGKNAAGWKYGRYLEVKVGHPVLNFVPGLGKDLKVGITSLRVPWVSSYFNIGPVPMSGSSTTVKQTTQKLAPSMRFIADLSDWDRSLNNITIGQSGQLFSSHYRDQWDDYYVGRSLPMRFRKFSGDVLRIHPGR
ncbi:MAG: penicillin acylase family protein, partial [Bryobacteraceae bacterium]